MLFWMISWTVWQIIPYIPFQPWLRADHLMESTLYSELLSQPVSAHLEDSEVIGPISTSLVHWPSIQQACTSNWNQNLCISKVICNQLPTMQIMFWQNHATIDFCLFCWKNIETSEDLFTWTHPEKRDLWASCLMSLHIWLAATQMDPFLVSIIPTVLCWWALCPSSNPTPFTSHIPTLANISADQHYIGWFAFLQGCLATSMINQQNQYFAMIGSCCSGTNRDPTFVRNYGILSRNSEKTGMPWFTGPQTRLNQLSEQLLLSLQ